MQFDLKFYYNSTDPPCQCSSFAFSFPVSMQPFTTNSFYPERMSQFNDALGATSNRSNAEKQPSITATMSNIALPRNIITLSQQSLDPNPRAQQIYENTAGVEEVRWVCEGP